MSVTLEVSREETGPAFVPKVLVFSTNNISDPGIDLAGSAHMHYSPSVVTLAVPCTSGIVPAWVLHALDQGFDGVFIASDGEECAYLTDCAERSARVDSILPEFSARLSANLSPSSYSDNAPVGQVSSGNQKCR